MPKLSLEDAAYILGVPTNCDLATLKNQYRRFATAFHPDKLKDGKSREKFQVVTQAYTMLLTKNRKPDDDCELIDSDEELGYSEDDVIEMRTFMKIFMDVVGILNDDNVSAKTVLSNTGLPFNLMNKLGTQRPEGAMEEWSTEEEDDDGDMDDDDDSDEEDDSDIFEPMAKNYYNMNLKESAGKERSPKYSEEDERDLEEEAKRKLKNAKKKTDKRRKQKEKKLKEVAEKELEEERAREKEEQDRKLQEEAARQRKEEIRKALELEAERRSNLFQYAASGNLEEVQRMIESNLVKCTERFSEQGKSGAGVIHHVINPPSALGTENNLNSRLAIASYLLAIKSPLIDLSCFDENGLNILHLSAKVGIIQFVDIILKFRGESAERRTQLDLNTHCLNFGYTALHYAADNGYFSVCERLVDSGVLLNVHATYISIKSTNMSTTAESSEQKGPTPLDLAHRRVTDPSLSPAKRDEYHKIIQKIENALSKIEHAKLAREQERLAKEAKLREEREAQLLKEQKEKELLDRKERQLKEKQEKIDRMRDENKPFEAHANTDPSMISGGNAEGVSTSSSSGKKKKKEKKKPTEKKPANNGGSSVAESISSLDSSALRAHELEMGPGSHQSAAMSGRGRSESSSSTGSASQKLQHPSTSVIPTALQPEEMNSRSELLNHLLAMGFPEDQCLAAIAACGLNADLAISWIVDRPPASPTVTARPVTQPKSSSTATAAKTPSVPIADTMKEAELREKALREKEKLRKINREWNAKVPQQRAEEERKKAEAEREARLEEERKKMAQMLAPHLKFPPDMHPQPMDQYGPGVVYGNGPVPPYGMMPPNYPYPGNGAYPMPPPQHVQHQYLPPHITAGNTAPSMGFVAGGISGPVSSPLPTAPYLPVQGRVGAPPMGVGNAGDTISHPSGARIQTWPNSAGPVNAGSYPPPGLPLAPAVNLPAMQSQAVAKVSSTYTGKGSPEYPRAGVAGGVAYSSPAGKGPTSNMGFNPASPSPPPTIGAVGRLRGPTSPTDFSPGQVFGYGVSKESDVNQMSSGDPQYADGAVELSVRAPEFVPRFSNPFTNPRVVSPGLSMSGAQAHAQNPVSSQQPNLGLGLWNTASVVGDLSNTPREDMSAPPLMFSSTDLGNSNSLSGGMGFDGLSSWGLSDGLDLQLPLQSNSRLPALSNTLPRFGGNDLDDADLDMGAALLGSDILGNFDESDILGHSSLNRASGRGTRQTSSFLSSFSQNSDFSDASSGGMFDNSSNGLR